MVFRVEIFSLNFLHTTNKANAEKVAKESPGGTGTSIKFTTMNSEIGILKKDNISKYLNKKSGVNKSKEKKIKYLFILQNTKHVIATDNNAAALAMP